ncbi:MAG: hypothetical protein IT207_01130 [Fimbriimonadaceae bacterium]|nr:hypothetical protein [Fimbriimonadaceae bacterium]
MKPFSIVLAAIVALGVLGCGPKQNTARSIEDVAAEQSTAMPEGGGPATTQPGTEAPGGPPVSAPGAGVPGAAPNGTNTAAPPAGANEPTPPPKVDGTGSADLKFAFHAKDTYTYKSSASVTSEGKGQGGKAQKSTYGTSQSLILKVLSVKDGVAEIQSTTKDLKVTGDANDPQAQMVKGIMAGSGELVSKAVYNARGIPQGSNPDLEDSVRSMVNGVGSALGVLGINYPATSVKPGDTWTATFDMGKLMSGRMPPGISATVSNGQIPTKYTLVSLDPAKGVAVIKVSMKGQPTMTVKLPAQKNSEGKEVQVPPMVVKLSVSSSGTATIDLKTGMPIEITTESTSETSGTKVMDGKQVSKSTTKRA